MLVGSTADRLIAGLRSHGRDWVASREGAAALRTVLDDGSAEDVTRAHGALRRYQALGMARAALRRYQGDTRARSKLRSQTLTGRELVASLIAWARTEPAAKVEDGRLVAPVSVLSAHVARVGDSPTRAVRLLRRAGLLESSDGSPTLVVRLPPEAVDVQ